MKYIIISIVAYVLISSSASCQTRNQDDSFTTLSTPSAKEQIAEGSYYIPINGRKAAFTTSNKVIAERIRSLYGNRILKARTRRNGRKYVFYLPPCREMVLAAVK